MKINQYSWSITMLLLLACGGSVDVGKSQADHPPADGGMGPYCEQDTTWIGCPCPNGGRGIARCNEDGTDFESCQCSDADGGSSGGSSAGGTGQGTGGNGNSQCTTDDIRSCACGDGSFGTMTCGSDHRFGPCQCTDNDSGAGGTNGSGGSTGGTGGTTHIDGGAAGAGGFGGTGTGGASGDADIIIQCPPSLPANECDNGRGWAMCEVQPITDIPRPSIIKGSGPAMYWYSADGKRYVFPDEETFRSWFPEGNDCPMIYEVPDMDLASVIIGGNVRFKPGSYLIKITSDPKVYAISCGAVLHWIETEALIEQLYGLNWQQHVLDVPDAFFMNYAVGMSINDVTDYDPTAELYAVESPDFDFACSAP